MQGWDRAHQSAASERRTEQEAAAGALAEMCQRAQDLGERFYPNEARAPDRPFLEMSCLVSDNLRQGTIRRRHFEPSCHSRP